MAVNSSATFPLRRRSLHHQRVFLSTNRWVRHLLRRSDDIWTLSLNLTPGQPAISGSVADNSGSSILGLILHTIGSSDVGTTNDLGASVFRTEAWWNDISAQDPNYKFSDSCPGININGSNGNAIDFNFYLSKDYLERAFSVDFDAIDGGFAGRPSAPSTTTPTTTARTSTSAKAAPSARFNCPLPSPMSPPQQQAAAPTFIKLPSPIPPGPRATSAWFTAPVSTCTNTESLTSTHTHSSSRANTRSRHRRYRSARHDVQLSDDGDGDTA